ncbi:MAG TPA: hypothetical protein VM913_08665 [Sphingomicrobium sp.]|nr:hypothetical protein [Sphingomicrobium sp.]
MKASFLLSALMLSAISSATAAVIVVRSSGPSAAQYPTGKSLPDNARVSLRGGDTLVLLDAKGSRTLRGPGSFPVAAGASKAAPTSFAALVAQGSSRRGRVGAVRPMPFPRQLWHASVDRPETFCFVQPNAIRLHRNDVTSERSVTVRDLSSGKSASQSFAARQQLADWPAAVPLRDGGHYRIGSVELHAKAVQPGSGFVDLGRALIEAGCNEQLNLLSAAAAPLAE